MAGVQHEIAWAGLHAIGAQLVESLASDAWTLLDQSGALEVFEPRAAWRQERAASLEPSSLFDHRDGVAAGSARHHLLDRAAFAGEERLLLHCQAEEAVHCPYLRHRAPRRFRGLDEQRHLGGDRHAQ